MIYVFDTSSFSAMKAYYPEIFKDFWKKINQEVASGDLISTKEVRREIDNEGNSGKEHEKKGMDAVAVWAKSNSSLFTTPSSQELLFVNKIFLVPHFQQLIGQKQQQRGSPVADPFVIACAAHHKGSVVTEEKHKLNSAKIPTVCEHFGVSCTNLEGFLKAKGWSF